MSSERAERLKVFMEKLKEMEEEAHKEDISLWGNAMGAAAPNAPTDLTNSPKYREIIGMLNQAPLLVGPTLNWMKLKMAAMARAQLDVLYTPEELQELIKETSQEKS